MLRRLLSRLAGGPTPGRADGATASPAPGPEAGPSAADPSGPPPAAANGAGPVFSSRAVRDASVVAGALEALKRFADGQIGVDEMGLKLSVLTPEQYDFLQLSAEPTLLDRAVARTQEEGGVKAGELRRLIEELGGSVGHRPAAQAPRSGGTGPAAPPPRSAPRISIPAKAPLRPGAGIAAMGAQPLVSPARATSAAAVPAPTATAQDPSAPRLASPDDSGDVPEPPPPPKPQASAADLPRMAKADADARRAKLMATLSDTLSTSEAAR